MNQDPSKMDINDLKSYISTKESEMKNILMQKIKSMDEELSSKAIEKNQLQSNYSKIKEAYDQNLLLLEERDSDLNEYESKFDSIDKVLELKDAEIAKGQREIRELTAIVKDEKGKRTQLEEYHKFNLLKALSTHKNDLKAVNDINDQLKNQIEALKAEISLMTIASSQALNKVKEEVIALTKTITTMQRENEEKELGLSSYKNTIEDLKNQIAKKDQDNTKLSKDKAALETTIKQFEIKESESLSSSYLLTQKNKCLQSELDHIKTDLNNKMNKIDIYITQIDELRNESFTHKQTIQGKEYEIEKEKFNAKLLNDKVNDLTNTIDKIIKDKSSIDTTLAASAKTYHEHIDKLTQENNDLKENITQLNSKVKELANVNVTLRESRDNNKVAFTQMDDSVGDAVDFFNQKPSQAEDYSMVKLELKQKDIEMTRMKQEYDAIVTNMDRIIEEYKNKELINADETNQYKQIVVNLEAKVNELEGLYDNEKKKLKNDLEGKVSKAMKENKKLREDKEKLMRMCSQLKIQVNNLNNDLSVKYETIAIEQQQAQMMMQYEQDPMMEGEFNEGEKEEIKRKTQKIVNRNMNMKDDDDVKEQAKKTINKVINQIHNYEGNGGNDSDGYDDDYNSFKKDNAKISQPLSPIRIENNSVRNNYDLSDCIQIEKVSSSQAASEKLRLIKRTNKKDIKSSS